MNGSYGNIAIAVALVFLTSSAALAANSVAVTTPHQAYSRALTYLGFEYMKATPPASAAASAKSIRPHDDRTPFLHQRIDSSSVWDITFFDVRLNLPNWPTTKSGGQIPKTYHVWIDSTTGQLLRIYARLDHFDPDLAPEPPAEKAEKYMMRGKEKVLGLPGIPPPVGFFEALIGAIASVPPSAKEIEAGLYLSVVTGDSTIPVWSIIGRGIPPHPGSPEGPLYIYGRRRTIVSALTGKPLFSTFGPAPERDTLFDRIWIERIKREHADSGRTN